MSFRGIKQLAQDHRLNKGQSQDLKRACQLAIHLAKRYTLSQFLIHTADSINMILLLLETEGFADPNI